jgi:hypothetical protein
MQARHVLIMGVGGYLALGVLAAWFYQERTIFLDPAFLLFSIASSGEFAIQANRFGSALTQFFPWLAVQLHLPIKWVMIIYSVGVVFYYFLCFYAVQRWLKNSNLALAVLLINTFIVSYTFWWMQIEFAQGIALAIVFLAFMTRERQWADYNPLEISTFFLLLITLLYFHPLIPFLLAYLLLFGLLDEKLKLPRKQFWTVTLLSAIILLFKNYVMPTAVYDDQASRGISNFKSLPSYINLQSNFNFLEYCQKDYYLLPLGLIACLVVLGMQRKWWKFVLLFGMFFAYLLLIHVAYPQGMPQFHIESFYLPLSVFVILPLIFDVLPLVKRTPLLLGGLGLILAIRIFHIGALHQPYTNRLMVQNKMLDKLEALNSKKIIMSEKEVPMDTLIMSWGSSFEFWLLSSLRNPDAPRSIVIDEDPARFDWTLSNNTAFFTEWGIYPYADLPKRYFNFTDIGYYQKGTLK